MTNILTMPQPAGASVLQALQALQQQFSLIRLSGDVHLVDHAELNTPSGDEPAQFNVYSLRAGDLLLRRCLENLPIGLAKSDVKTVIDSFKTSPNTREFDRVAFSPKPQSATTLNLWRGPTMVPVPGAWTVLQDFLRHDLCSGDPAVFDYLMNYLAHMLQKPEEKPGIMLVMLSKQGTGKGTFFRLLQRIWGHSTVLVNTVDHIVGHFNGILERSYVICMDEAIFKGEKKSMEKMKSLITEPQVMIEQKHQPAHPIDSHHRFIAASNQEHFGQIEISDRRYVFLRVSSQHHGDHAYFSALHQAIDDDGQVGAMVYDLLQRNLTGFNIRQRPITAEGLRQRLQSLTGIKRFWYEQLYQGTMTGYDAHVGHTTVYGWPGPFFIGTGRLRQLLEEFDRNIDRYAKTLEQQLAEELREICPSAKSVRKKAPYTSQQLRGYLLPTLAQARQEFEACMGEAILWPAEPELIDDGSPTTSASFIDTLLSTKQSRKNLDNWEDAAE